MKKFLLTTFLAAALGCDSYNPDLGDTPFLCGTEDPTCPEGYGEVWVTTTRCECQKAVSTPESDGGGGECNADTNEPNEMVSAATATPVGAGSSTVTLNAAICPPNDQDVYRLMVQTAGDDVVVDVNFTASAGDLTCDILNSSGTPVATCASAGSGHVHASHTTAFAGTYYARVKTGDPGVQGNYSVDIKVQ